MPIINRNPETPASRLRVAREKTGLLSTKRESFLTRLAPQWNQNIIQSEASSGPKDLPAIKNPFGLGRGASAASVDVPQSGRQRPQAYPEGA